MTQFYTYLLINSLDNQPFYVGKGVKERMYTHAREAKRLKNKRSVHRKILSILEKGGEITYEQVFHPDEAAAFAEEMRLIALHGRKDLGTGILCNLTEGGEGAANKARSSIEAGAAKHRGMKRSDEAKQNMRVAQAIIAARNRELYGTGVKPETIQKMSANRKGKMWSETARATVRKKPTARPVLVYRKDTKEFVGEWESISLCARELGCDTTSVWKICEKTPCSMASNGIKYPMKSHKGYTFEYK